MRHTVRGESETKGNVDEHRAGHCDIWHGSAGRGRLDHRLRRPRPRLRGRSISRVGRPARAVPDRPHRALGRVVVADALRGCPALRPGPSRLQLERCRRADLRRRAPSSSDRDPTATDRPGPARTHMDAPADAAVVLPCPRRTVRAVHQRAVSPVDRRVHRGGRRRCSGRLRPPDPGSRDLVGARRAGRVGRHVHGVGAGLPRVRSRGGPGHPRPRRHDALSARAAGVPTHPPRRRPDERVAAHRDRRRTGRRPHDHRHGGADLGRRCRHHVVGHRFGDAAPRDASRRRSAADRRARDHAARHRGAAAGLFAGHDGAHCHR